MKVYIVFDFWEEYDDYEDHVMPRDDLVDVFLYRENAIECIKELIAKHNVKTSDDGRNLDIHGEIWGYNPEDDEMHKYYILERLVR